MLFEDFQDGCHGGHLGYWNGMILAILNGKSPCGPNVSHQVWAQSDLGFGSRDELHKASVTGRLVALHCATVRYQKALRGASNCVWS